MEIANELLSKCGIKGKISNLQECDDAYFVNIYRGLLGDDLKGTVSYMYHQSNLIKTELHAHL